MNIAVISWRGVFLLKKTFSCLQTCLPLLCKNSLFILLKDAHLIKEQCSSVTAMTDSDSYIYWLVVVNHFFFYFQTSSWFIQWTPCMSSGCRLSAMSSTLQSRAAFLIWILIIMISYVHVSKVGLTQAKHCVI